MPCKAYTGQEQNDYISIYQGEILDDRTALIETKKLSVAFPDLQPEFINILCERLVANGFTNERLKNAIANVIDNFQYKTPKISDIIGFDKRVKLYSYNEVGNLVTSSEATFNDFYKIKRNGKLFWIKKSEKEMYNLQDEIL